MTDRDAKLEQYRQEVEGLDAQAIVQWAVESFSPGKVPLASSLGAEDQALTHMLAAATPTPRILTLDTGRLFQESFDAIQASMERYNLTYEILYPEAAEVSAMVTAKGPNLFYASVENRKECCSVRKIRPLRRALANADAWITGLRRAQSVTRTEMPIVEWDEAFDLFKVNPLFDWSEADVWAYIREHDVPYNKLHDQGFPSIGCQPCTRAVKDGEDVRAGRWWWEAPEQKECGLHVVDGKLTRARTN